MKTNLLSKLIILLIIAVTTTSNVFGADWFVKPNANGTGASWDDPANISIITTDLSDGDIVYLSAGNYSRTTVLTVTKYITIKGGYPANATGNDLNNRNITANKSILMPAEGSQTRGVAINAGATTTGNKVTLDGLYFEGFAMATGNGGTALAITSAQADIDINNCEFNNNVSLNANGGAINMASFAHNIKISFNSCNFNNNQANFTTANAYGGAAYFNNGTTAKTIDFTNCNFKNNTAYGRAGALYFTSVITSNITDCYFDSNYSSNTTDNFSNGNGACIYVAGGTASNTFNLNRTVIVNSSGTAKGSVFWFNATPKNYLNLNNSSLIGNYAKRTGSARAAIDADNLTTNIEVTINNSVLSNYNWSGGAKASNRADLIYLSTASSNGTATTFTNSILNGLYFTSGNAYDAISPAVLYPTTGYLADSTINLALAGDLKITDKIVLKQSFGSNNVGSFVHNQIFDVKQKMNFPLQIIANIANGYILNVNGTDYNSGENVNITIPAATTPSITLRADNSTAINSTTKTNIVILQMNGESYLTGLSKGNTISVYNTTGQLLSQSVAQTESMRLDAKGMVIVKINDGTKTHNLKTLLK